MSPPAPAQHSICTTRGNMHVCCVIRIFRSKNRNIISHCANRAIAFSIHASYVASCHTSLRLLSVTSDELVPDSGSGACHEESRLDCLPLTCGFCFGTRSRHDDSPGAGASQLCQRNL